MNLKLLKLQAWSFMGDFQIRSFHHRTYIKVDIQVGVLTIYADTFSNEKFCTRVWSTLLCGVI